MNTVRRHTVTGFGAWPEAKPTYRIQFSNAELGVELTSSYMRMTAAEAEAFVDKLRDSGFIAYAFDENHPMF